jgi:hypothetical protein
MFVSRKNYNEEGLSELRLGHGTKWSRAYTPPSIITSRFTHSQSRRYSDIDTAVNFKLLKQQI